MGIEKKLTLKQLREKHADVLNSPGVKAMIALKRFGETHSFGDQSAEANKYATDENAYFEHFKQIIEMYKGLPDKRKLISLGTKIHDDYTGSRRSLNKLIKLYLNNNRD